MDDDLKMFRKNWFLIPQDKKIEMETMHHLPTPEEELENLRECVEVLDIRINQLIRDCFEFCEKRELHLERIKLLEGK